MLKLDRLTRRFGHNFAVNEISLEIPDGQMLGLVGAPGAGRSTLLRLINRLLDPTEGRIWFGGTDIGSFAGRELRLWRSHCAMICGQGGLAGSASVMTNVLNGAGGGVSHWRLKAQMFTPRERAAAMQAMARLDVDHLAQERVERLTRAEQRRVAIARALAQAPRLLLADDVTLGLDRAEAEALLATLRRLNREAGVTILLGVTVADLADGLCDRVLGMAQGRVVFDAAPGALGPLEMQAIAEDPGLAPWARAVA